MPNLLSNSLDRFMCWYQQLQIVVIDEILLVGARMLNVINNMLRFIKHIQNIFFGGLNLIMTSEFYQTPLWKILESFKMSMSMLMHNTKFMA